MMRRHQGRHRVPVPPRPVAPLAPARPLDDVELEVEGLFIVLRHLVDGHTPDDAWALGRIDVLDIRTAQACAS
jgi:hypothetical protein